MLAREDEEELIASLVGINGEWTFEFRDENGRTMRCRQTWPTEAEAEQAIKTYVATIGGRYYSAH